jgi:glucose/arabinose dehydrogenase
VAKDGALLVSEDTNGVIYRISHEGGPQQARASD